MKLEYRKGDMLKNMNKEDVFLHACNCCGVWGHGIAAQLRTKFPNAFEQHKQMPNTLGSGYVLEDRGYKIGCLMTSKRYGQYIDSPKSIVEQTYKALRCLLETLEEEDVVIHSPKINAGLFRTPWPKTKKAIKQACEESGKKIRWIVWEL